RERVAVNDVETARARGRRHLAVRIDATRADAGAVQRGEEFAAAAADVDDVAGAGEERQVLPQSLGYGRIRAAKLILERDVDDVGRRRRWNGRRRRGGGDIGDGRGLERAEGAAHDAELGAQ